MTAIAASQGDQPGQQDEEDLQRAGSGRSRARGRRSGVDEPGADLEPGGEAAGPPGQLVVEEVLEPGVQTDADDQRGVVAVGEQERDVLGGRRGRRRRSGRTPSRLDRAPARRCRAPRGREEDDVGGDPQRVGGRHRAGVAGGDDHDVGRPAQRRAGRRRRAPTAMTAGSCSRTNWPDRRQVGVVGVRRRRRPARPASRVVSSGSPRPLRSSSCSRRRNSLVLCVSVSSWTSSPDRAWAISARTVVEVEGAAGGDRLLGRRTRRRRSTRRHRIWTPSRDRGPAPSVPMRSTSSTPASASTSGPEVGVAAGDHRCGVDDRADPRVDQRGRACRGRGRRGRAPRCRRGAAAGAASRSACPPGRSP